MHLGFWRQTPTVKDIQLEEQNFQRHNIGKILSLRANLSDWPDASVRCRLDPE